MIKKTIIIAILLFVLYTVFVIRLAPNTWHATQHQWADNVIKAQNFLYNTNDSIQNIIVGTSLACMIVTDSLPSFYNLGFQGQSIYDGLSILSHKSKLYKNVFIEMNYAFNDEGENFTSSLFSPFLYYPRKIFPSLREEKQPLAIMGAFITDAFKNIKNKIHGNKRKINQENTPKDSLVSKKVVNTDLFNKSMEIKTEFFSRLPNTKKITERFTKLKIMVSKLENRGINVVFFEMPIHHQLENLPYVLKTRASFSEYFPASKFKYISLPVNVEYHTSDGIHLTKGEALNYTQFFKAEIDPFCQ